jgi:hypothetical protein
MAVFAHFALFHSDQGAVADQGSAGGSGILSSRRLFFQASKA